MRSSLPYGMRMSEWTFTAGRVPVKSSAENGTIAPGDLLVASATPGHAMRAPANPAPGTVIGKALGTLAHGTGVMEMLVMLR